MTDSNPKAAGSRVVPFFRGVLGLEVFFNIASLATIGIFPDQTATKFAWEIKSTVTAAVFGSLYLSVAPTGLLQFFAKRWENIRVMILPLIVFTSAELVATLVHLDKFFVGTLRFNIWLASYLIPPPLLTIMYVYQERRSSHPPVQAPLPTVLRGLIIALGAMITADGAIAFLNPSYYISSFPWDLTPLTARVLAAWVLALGTILLSVARENDKDRVRVASPILVLLLPALGAQLVRFADQVDLTHPRIWANLVIFSILAACGVYLAKPKLRG